MNADQMGLFADPPRVDLVAGVAAKRAGMEQVLNNAGEPWQDRAMSLMRQFVRVRREFIGEEFRLFAVERGLPEPHHPNAWSALWRAVAAGGLARITDRTRPMQVVRSHGRRSPVWQSLVA